MFTALDVGFGLLVLISAVLATARGLTREILSLLTWAGSAAIAAYMYFKHPEIAQAYIKETVVANVVTVAGSFIVSLIVLHLITMRVADFVVDSRIGPLDRTLGFVFGILRGVVIAVVVVIFGLWLFPDTTKFEWAKDSRSLPYLQNFGDELIAALPTNLEEQVTSILKHNNAGAPTVPTGTDDNATPDSTAPDSAAAGDNASPDATAPSTDAPAAPATAAPATAPANPGANSGV
ncbi:MAG TPA: CvpA family protein [Devosiaceae bacterium]|nr:CvpA family protein [Devosiaceae bacterium]